jgi:beta-glucoside operon transcriptional antiterminator
MEVVKKINNNVVLAVNSKKEEVFLVGKGLGFKKTPYKVIDEDVGGIIEKVYVAPKNMEIFDILNDLPFEDIALAEEIIQQGKKVLNKELNQTILITLSDHISFALRKTDEERVENNMLQWEVNTLYPKEAEVGQIAIDLIKERTGISLPQSEITLIALHFINAQIGSGEMSETRKITKITGEILSIVKYSFNKDFDETSYTFTRFATHLRYFIIRQLAGKPLESESENLYVLVKDQYPIAIKCVEKIEQFVHANYGWTCSEDEKLYLTLHLQKLFKTK